MVGDALWESVSPLLPTPATRAKGGRPRIPDRAVLAGILYVLRTGIPWNMLPAEFGNRAVPVGEGALVTCVAPGPDLKRR